MSKNKKEEVVSELNNTALSTFQNKETGEWFLAFIKFNPETGETKWEKAVSCGESKVEAEDQFKIASYKLEII